MLDIQAEFVENIIQDTTTDRDVTPIDEYRDRAVLHVCGLVDGAGNICEGYQTLSGNDTIIRLFRVDHTTGQRSPIADVSAPPGFKMDDFHFWQSGSNVLIGLVAHEAISAPTRRNIYARALVPGVLTPYPGGMEPRGAYIDPSLLGGGEPMPNPVDPQAIADAVAATLTTDRPYQVTLQKFAKNGGREAIQAEGVSTPVYLRDHDALLQVLRDGLASFVRDRAYEGAMAALDAHATKAQTL